MTSRNEDTRGWQTVGGARKHQRPAEENQRGRGPRKPGNKQSARKQSPMRVRPANRKQEEEHKSQGVRLSSVDQGDGSVVFKQLVNYLINKASAEYVWDTITRLNDLARARRVPESDNSFTQQEGSQVKEEERRTEWMDEMPEVLRNQFEWLMSYWNKNKINVQRLQQLMTTWIVEVNCKQDELETRLRCFTFVDNAESNKTDEDNEEKSTPKSYLGAVAKGLQPKDNSQSKELKKLYELCMTPMETLAVPRRCTEEEDRALLMILTHELEVPHPPRFLVQTMTGEEIARFIDIFKAIEYPLYAHLAPGQRFGETCPSKYCWRRYTWGQRLQHRKNKR
ncbi:hypothetical protein PR003_g1163 [Phytophthora rubi]|uniref:Uncharacterized protein n=2 Tax=Phytophthora rubi TaxID=129364 RepID=A0A6A4G4X6_9STRA|nr:hypothetical protein PR003_g1163 [Phytophthora rubi]